MKTRTIFDAYGRVLALVDLHDGGHAILRTADRAVHAYYDPAEDCTRDAFNCIIARGDQIDRLLPYVCRHVARR